MATKHVTRPRRTSRSSSSRPRIPVTLDRVKILRHFGKVSTEPVDPAVLARAFDIERLDPDRGLLLDDRACLVLDGVAATLHTLAAEDIKVEDTDARHRGETMYFLAKTIKRALGWWLAAHPAENSRASAYQVIRPSRRRR